MELLNIKDYIEDIDSLVNGKYISHISDMLYEIINKNYPRGLLGKWFYFNYKPKYKLEEYSVMKEVDEETYYNLYCRLFNPVSVFIYEDYFKKPYYVKVRLDSIDDCDYSAEFNNLRDMNEVNDVIYKLFSYIDSKEIINGKELIKYSESIGGVELPC